MNESELEMRAALKLCTELEEIELREIELEKEERYEEVVR